MSRDYITGKAKLPEGPESGIGELDMLQMQETQSFTFGDSEPLKFGDVASIQARLYFDFTKRFLVLDRPSEVPIDEVVVGVTMPGRALSIEYAPVFDSDLSYAAASALVVQMSPTADGATGGNRANAIYARFTHPTASKAVQGCSAAGEFEQVHAASAIVQASYGVLRLVDRNDGVTVSANRSFIMVRDYSTAAYRNPNLVNFWSFPALALSDETLLALAGSIAGNKPYNATVRCVYGTGNTPIYLMATTTPPNALQDFKMMGTTTGNYMWWKADIDALYLFIAGKTVVGEDHALDITFYGTVAAVADQMVGLNVTVQPAGAHSDWVSGIFARVLMPAETRPVDGYVSAAELEVLHSAGAAVQCAYYILNLNDTNGGVTVSAVRAYIGLNDYSGAAYRQPNLFHFKSAAGRTSPADDDTILTEPGVVRGGTFDVAVRNLFGTTPFWLLGTTVVPEVFADLKVMGSAIGNYLEWDASADQLNLVVPAKTVDGEDYGLSVALTGTVSEDADHLVGINVAVVPAGIHGGWVSAIYGKVTMPATGRPIDGYVTGAELEVIHTAGVAVQCAYYVLNLADNNGGVTVSAVRAYIALNDYSVAAYRQPNLFSFNSAAGKVTPADDDVILTEPGVVLGGTFNVAVRNLFGVTPFWFMGTTVTPEAFADLKVMGSAAGNYLEWDASADKLNAVLAASTVPASTTYAGDKRVAEIDFTGTFPSGGGQSGGMEGLRVSLTPLGTNGRRLSGIYSVVNLSGAGDILTGSYCAAEFEVVNSNTGNQCTAAVLQLRYNVTTVMGFHPASAFIRLRDPGTAHPLNLFNMVNESLASAWDSGRMVRLSTTPKAATHVIECIVNDVPLYIIATTTAPTD